jgi:phage tail sheath protein FI
MANFTVSPGVTTNELDQTFLSGQPLLPGAAIIGPTVKGPYEVPTLVTSYSDFQTKFGDSFVSGGVDYSYLTSIAAYNYFNYGGKMLTVARVASGSYTPATSNIPNTVSSTNGTFATASIEISSSYTASSDGTIGGGVLKIGVPSIGSTYTDYWLQHSTWVGTNSYYDAAFNVGYISMSVQPTLNEFGTLIADFINSTTNQQFNPTTTPTEINQLFSASFETSTKVLSIFPKQSSSLYNGTTIRMGAKPGSFVWGGSPDENFVSSSIMANGVDGVSSTSFTLETLSEGEIMNSAGPTGSNGSLLSGSRDNIRFEITNVNTGSGTFNVLIRQGNDTINDKNILESFNNVNLDPNSIRYISTIIGDQKRSYNSTTNQITLTGDYSNNSNYVRVKSVNYPTPTYLNSNGTISNASYTSSLPTNGSGSFSGATGIIAANVGTTMYENITTTTQGLAGSDYDDMITLFANKDLLQFNLLFTPGLLHSKHSSQVNTIISNTQNRGDNLYVLDLIDYNSTVTSTVTQASGINNSFAATYWPWVKILDPATGKQIWSPASTVIPGVYAFNDKIAAPWFAPAGINRGGLSTVLRAEQLLNQANKDILYSNNINPLATLPKNGVVVFGQKTLQKEASALDRVNVRRLLLELKNYISQIADTVVFEQNTISTRNSFLAKVTPYLENIQQKQGLYAFKVVMDESNNGPAVIDQNQLIGQIYVQPTRTAEFISLDFILLPTGAEFPG